MTKKGVERMTNKQFAAVLELLARLIDGRL